MPEETAFRKVMESIGDSPILQKKSEYEELQKKYIGDIRKAMDFSPEIGSTDVRKTYENTERETNLGKWSNAIELLEDAYRKAKLVIAREPFLTKKQQHQGMIETAFNIKKDDAGDGFKTRWKAIIKPLYDGDPFNADEAETKLDTLIRDIEQKKVSLKTEMDQVKTELNDLKQQLKNPEITDEALYEISMLILEKSAEAKGLGFDPGEKAREPFVQDEHDIVWTAQNCEQVYKDYDWFALKDFLKDNDKKIMVGEEAKELTEDGMWKLFQYRGKVVNEEIDKQRQAYPTLIAKASGSEDIGSDIDITFATPKSGDDVAAAQAFNKAIIKRYGKPAGRVFDVNIYPRDYGAIKESFKPDYLVDINPDDGIDEPEQEESMKLSKIDQDVATLLKQRRFMTQEDFDEMLESMLASARGDKSGDVAKQVQKQYEEGEDLYYLTSLEKVEKIRSRVKLDEQLSDTRETHRQSLVEKLGQLDAITGEGGKTNYALAQQLIPEILDLFEETYQDETMEVTDALYLEKMGSLRKDQETIRTLKQNNVNPEEDHPGKTCEQAHPQKNEKGEVIGTIDHAAWRTKKLNALEVKVKKDMFTNIIFANEAIMSQGAIKHIVQGLQAKTDEEKIEVLKKLSASDLMQSVNEQVADLYKEMKHYDGVVEEAGEGKKDSATGEAFVHASKYFFRLLDAAISLNLKYKDEDKDKPEDEKKYKGIYETPYTAVANEIDNNDLGKVKEEVDKVLLQLRKSSDIPADVKGRVGAMEMKRIFPEVTDIAAFRTMVTEFAKDLNNRIRSLEDFQESQKMAAEGEKTAEKDYFEHAVTEEDKARSTVTAAGANPLDAKWANNLQEALTQLGLSNAAAIAQAFNAAATAVAGLGTSAGEGATELVGNFNTLVNRISDSGIKTDLSIAVAEYRKRIEIYALTQARSDLYGNLPRDFDEAEKARKALEPLASKQTEKLMVQWGQEMPSNREVNAFVKRVTDAVKKARFAIEQLKNYHNLNLPPNVEKDRLARITELERKATRTENYLTLIDDELLDEIETQGLDDNQLLALETQYIEQVNELNNRLRPLLTDPTNPHIETLEGTIANLEDDIARVRRQRELLKRQT